MLIRLVGTRTNQWAAITFALLISLSSSGPIARAADEKPADNKPTDSKPIDSKSIEGALDRQLLDDLDNELLRGAGKETAKDSERQSSDDGTGDDEAATDADKNPF